MLVSQFFSRLLKYTFKHNYVELIYTYFLGHKNVKFILINKAKNSDVFRTRSEMQKKIHRLLGFPNRYGLVKSQ